jgi:hypothetical protein
MITSLIRLSAVLLTRRNGESSTRDSLGSGRVHRGIRIALRFYLFLHSTERTPRTSRAHDRCDRFACLGNNEINDSENTTLSTFSFAVMFLFARWWTLVSTPVLPL